MLLDPRLCIRDASKSYHSAFKVGPEQTLGKKLTELGNGQWNIPALLKLLNELPMVGGEFDDFEMGHDFPDLGRKTMLVSGRRLMGDMRMRRLPEQTS